MCQRYTDADEFADRFISQNDCEAEGRFGNAIRRSGNYPEENPSEVYTGVVDPRAVN